MSTRAVVINPMGVHPGSRGAGRGYDIKPSAQPQGFWQRHSTKAKVLLSLGVLGLVGIIAFSVGEGARRSDPEASGADFDSGSLTQAKAGLNRWMAEYAVTEKLDQGCSQAVANSTAGILGRLNYTSLNVLLDEFESTGEDNWNDSTMTIGVMKMLQSYRDEAVKQRTAFRATGRSLSESGSLRKGTYRRELAFSGSNDIAQSWEKIESETYSGAVTFKTDRVAVRKEGSTCWIVAEETNEAGDWFNNLNAGTADIKSINKYNVRDSSCGCERRTLGYCREYKTCATYKTIGKGFKGFVNTYNTMRFDIWNKVKSTCGTGASIYRVTGYSRGAALSTPLVYTLIEDGLIPKSKIRMVTFGSPRALTDESSDVLHNHMSGSNFRIDRLVNRQDLVVSVPFDWWGFKHVGNMDCFQCEYPKGRDRPFYAWSIPHHTEYCQSFGNARC